MHNSCTKDCRALVVIGCAHSTVARWVNVFWSGRESGKQNKSWHASQLQQQTMSAFHVWGHYLVWPDGGHVQNHRVRLVLDCLPSTKLSCRVWKYENVCWVATKMSDRDTHVQHVETARVRMGFCGCESETFLCRIFTNYEIWPISYGPDLKIRQWCEWCHQWSPLLCRYQQEQVSWKSCSAWVMITRAFLLHMLSFLAWQ